MTAGTSPRWRSLLRYRLRSLLFVATVIAVGLAAWVQMVEKPYERQQAALDALESFAPRVYFAATYRATWSVFRSALKGLLETPEGSGAA